MLTQSKPINQRSSQNRQINDGMFLLCSPKFLNSERSLQCYSFIKKFFGKKIIHLTIMSVSPMLEGIFDTRLQQLQSAS